MTDNKTIVQRAFATLLDGGDVDALAPALSDDFIHHRPGGITSTRTEWLAGVRAAFAEVAGMKVEMLHVLADGDHVVVHTRRSLPEGPSIAVVDIIRLDGGLVAEAWEIIEPVAQAEANRTWWQPRPAG